MATKKRKSKRQLEEWMKDFCERHKDEPGGTFDIQPALHFDVKECRKRLKQEKTERKNKYKNEKVQSC